MILQSLVQLAERERLLDDPGYVAMPVHWAIDVAADGRVLNVRHLGERAEGAKKEQYPSYPMPKRRSRGGLKVQPDLLVDKGQYLLGLGDPKKPNKHDRLAACLAAMIEETAAMACATGDEGVKAQEIAMLRFREEPAELLERWLERGERSQVVPQGDDRSLKVPARWRTNHLFGFFFDGDPVWRRPAVLQHVREHADVGQPEEGNAAFCLVTGEWTTPTETHDQFDLAGDTGRLPLVSFNNVAFEHHGRSRNENAPVGTYAANAYFMALRRLLARGQYRHPGTGEVLPRRNHLLSPDTTAVYWADSGSQGDPTDDLLMGDILAGNPEAIEQVPAIYRAPRVGRPVLLEDPTPFHTLVLTRVKSRVVVRTADTKTVAEVARSVEAYLDELLICSRYSNEREYRGIRSLLDALVFADSKTSQVPPDLASRLLQCALDHRYPFPREILAVVLRRLRSHDSEGLSTRRAALLRAVLNRTCNQEMTVSLDPSCANPAYQLGRLFAVLEKIQSDALGDVNATIADRYLGSAMGTPALVFPRLLKLAHHHLAKLGQDKPGLQVTMSRRLDEIVGRLPPQMPASLQLVDQGTFIVGYHHERADLWKPKAARAASDAPQHSPVSNEESTKEAP